MSKIGEKEGAVKQLTWRALLLSGLGSVLITASSMYVALRMSALPWPTVFVAVLSMGLLKLWGKTNVHEVNIAKTGMSAGAMIAGGVAFTLPGLWITGYYEPYDPATGPMKDWLMPKFWPIFLVTLAGTVLGALLCWQMRRYYLKRLNLPYPIGTAAAETISAAEEGGKQGKWLFGTLAASSAFTLLRDAPSTFGASKPWIPASARGTWGKLPVGIELSPMALGIGYLIGFGPTAFWFFGALVAHWLIGVYGVTSGTFTAETAGGFSFTAAIGLMVGAGVGILLSFIKTLMTPQKKSGRGDEKAFENSRKSKIFSLIAVILGYVFAVGSGLHWGVSLLLLVGTLFATAMSAMITGQTGINPMEIFAIIILLAIRIFFTVDTLPAFLITAVVAVACGFAGDLMNDYKAGDILGTDPKAQLISELIGGVLGSIVAVVGLFAIIYQYGGVGGDTGLSAVQAHTVSAMVGGIGDTFVFVMAGIIGALMYMFKIPSMIIGIGMLLPFSMSLVVFLGGLIQYIVQKVRERKSRKRDTALIPQIVAAGLLGGEGITGTVLAIIAMIRG